jgi:dTDP-4-amino-4,6-dideoxygalactose transaminase
VLSERRDELRKYLNSKNIPTMIYYPKPLHKQKAFIGHDKGSFPNSDDLETKVLSLPMHTELSDETIFYITNSIKSFK